jgi:two-component system, NarL family, invasion response regulator UvrY
MQKKIKIVLVDDNVLLRHGLAVLLAKHGFDVLFEADHGKDFISKIDEAHLPDVVLMDINMPEMDGFEATAWLTGNHPTVKTIALTMYDTESSIIKIFSKGARGFILKDADPKELAFAIDYVLNGQMYFAEKAAPSAENNYRHEFTPVPVKDKIPLDEEELKYIRLAATPLNSREIAHQMKYDYQEADNCRTRVFSKLEVSNRVGVVLYALKNGLVPLS